MHAAVPGCAFAPANLVQTPPCQACLGSSCPKKGPAVLARFATGVCHNYLTARPHPRRTDPTHLVIITTHCRMTTNLAETTKLLDSIRAESFQSDTDRYEAKEAARRLLARLETPFERGWALTTEVSVLVPGLMVFHDLGIWSKWTELNKSHGQIPQSLGQIVEMCSAPAEPNLLRESG